LPKGVSPKFMDVLWVGWMLVVGWVRYIHI